MWSELPRIPGAQMINRGRGGDTTAQVLARLDRDAIALNPQIVVLQVGINDLKAIGVLPERAAEIQASCRENIKHMVGDLELHGIHVVVLTIFPVGRVELVRRAIWSRDIDNAVVTANTSLRELSSSLTTVIDGDLVFAVNGRMNPKYANGALHLNEAGYAALSETVLVQLKQILDSDEKQR